MKMKLTLLVIDKTGLQLRVINAMKKLGLICTDLHSYQYQNNQHLLELELSGQVQEHQVVFDALMTESLKEIDGVLKYKKALVEADEESHTSWVEDAHEMLFSWKSTMRGVAPSFKTGAATAAAVATAWAGMFMG